MRRGRVVGGGGSGQEGWWERALKVRGVCTSGGRFPSVLLSLYSARLHRLEQPRDHTPPLRTLGIRCSAVLMTRGLSKLLWLELLDPMGGGSAGQN